MLSDKRQRTVISTYHGRFDVVPTSVEKQSLANATDLFPTDGLGFYLVAHHE